jgi:hypothetical protein
MSQTELPLHCTDGQAPVPEQLIVHVQPDGQMTVPHALVEVQSTVQVIALSSQDVQENGQLLTTQ